MNLKSKLSIFVAFTLTMMLSSVASAFPSGPDGAPWKASADVVGTGGSASIVVTDATHAGCAQQFSDAMASHYIHHGWEFENIQYCHFNPYGPVIGDVVELQEAKEELDTQIADLEAEFDVARFISLRNKVIRLYRKRLKQAQEPTGVSLAEKLGRVGR
ncbi:MAG: hypothetical protein P8Q97_05810 [Myxococcota bacterium]|jgi:hypothetical protein|nr:hypothetical protein [Myxococcota bacterium]